MLIEPEQHQSDHIQYQQVLPLVPVALQLRESHQAFQPMTIKVTTLISGTPITAPGGGGGGHDSNNGGPGGSGGGGSGVSPPTAGPGTGSSFPGTIGATPTSGWGHDGGTGTYSSTYAGAGGGVEEQEQMVSMQPILDQVVLVSNSQQHLEILPLVGGPGPTSAPTPNGFDTSVNIGLLVVDQVV